MTKYNLPELSYDYGALEPHISGAIMELHHSKHHKAYVDGANKTNEQLLEARTKDDFTRIGPLEQALAFHVSGHVLHSLFWQNLAPKAGGKPVGPLAEAIDRDFGSFDLFKKQLNGATAAIMGSGWGALVFEPLSRRLTTVQLHDHQSVFTMGSVPLLVLDAWEHAWYLQYKNEKAKFFEAVWNLWNWTDVSKRFEAAQKLDLGLSPKVVAV